MSALAPENTLAAFRACKEHGVNWFEFDVGLIADGTAVVIHDDTLDRTTDATGPVASLTAADLAHIDAGSCNGCELEIHALNNPYYNLEAIGIKFAASPRHADLLRLTGPVAKNMEVALKRAYDDTPEPRLVVAVGDCGCTGGIFGESYASCGRVSNVIPVDVSIPGCPPTPLQLMQGILAAIAPELKNAEAQPEST